MKHVFLATSGLPGTNNFNGLMFEVETKTDMTQSEVTDSLRKAARKYVMTDRGANYLQNTCGSFNWGDFVDSYDVPEFAQFLTEAGLTITFLGSVTDQSNLLDWDEQLIDYKT